MYDIPLNPKTKTYFKLPAKFLILHNAMFLIWGSRDNKN
jgi:hypothetical protein